MLEIKKPCKSEEAAIKAADNEGMPPEVHYGDPTSLESRATLAGTALVGGLDGHGALSLEDMDPGPM
jgi:hypothetical protein